MRTIMKEGSEKWRMLESRFLIWTLLGSETTLSNTHKRFGSKWTDGWLRTVPTLSLDRTQRQREHFMVIAFSAKQGGQYFPDLRAEGFRI